MCRALYQVLPPDRSHSRLPSALNQQKRNWRLSGLVICPRSKRVTQLGLYPRLARHLWHPCPGARPQQPQPARSPWVLAVGETRVPGGNPLLGLRQLGRNPSRTGLGARDGPQAGGFRRTGQAPWTQCGDLGSCGPCPSTLDRQKLHSHWPCGAGPTPLAAWLTEPTGAPAPAAPLPHARTPRNQRRVLERAVGHDGQSRGSLILHI